MTTTQNTGMLALTKLIQRAPHVTSNSSLHPTHDEYVYAMEKLNLNLKSNHQPATLR